MPASSNSEIEPILGIQFSIFSPDEIERRSVVEITSNATYEGNEPKIGGLFDPRMGVLENGKQCRSCGQSNNGCPGHFAHYRLGRPVYYIQFLPMILSTLSCVCISCSKLLVDKELRTSVRSKKGEGRWKELLEASGNISRCGQETEDGCGARQPDRYKREGIARIVAEWDTIDTKDVKRESMKQPLEVEYVQRLFRRITDEDVAFMGLNPRWCRPDWMICSVLAIPPPQVRPSVVQENNQRSEDDLTHKLFEIIKTNKMLLVKMEAEGSKTNKGYIDELTNVLQYHIATLVDNQIPGVAPSAQRGGRPLKSIQQRLGSKEGRIRYNLQGKRVEFSARSVITPDPNISIAELGVPTKIAMNLTVPERVTDFNRDKLYKLVQNGTAVYPGAKTIVRADGRMISLAHVITREIVLYNGDLVNRHLMDGDMVLFNRQPTLHRMSMMGHRVRVLPYNTFRLNVSVTSPYNADFDGDEMNAHIPQSSEAIQELQDIAAVPYQMISPRHQKPVIKVVQDALLGSHRITKQGEKFTRREYMNLMMWNKRFNGKLPEPEIVGGAPRWSGQQVLSMLFPPMNTDLKNKFYDDDQTPENMVKIRDGMIVGNGIVDDDVLNKTGVGVVHTTYNDFGAFAAVDLLDSVQSTIEAYLVMSGFSVGLSDLVADDKTLATMNDIVQKRKKDIDEIVLQVHMDLFDNNTGKTNQDEFESQVFGKLNKAIEELGKLGQQALAQENRMISMLKAGSKGSTINVSQMVACVGQQNIEGRRIPYGFTDRTLPHYKKFDDGAEARGFVENSFVKGLTPQEFFFHAMSGREGLIDTAVKTAETGYLQRQMVKAMEDLVTQHDGTVRDARGGIVQFHYGEDGLSSTKVETQGLPLHSMSDEDIRATMGLQGVNWADVLSVPRTENAELLNSFVDTIIEDRNMLVNGVFRNGRPKSLQGPMNLDRMILNLKVKFNIQATAKTDLTPEYVLERLRDLQARTLPFHKMWAAMLRFHLGPHSSVVKHRLTQLAFNALMEQILVKNWASWAQPGEQVGIIAAQSIGEPATQMSNISSSFIVLNSLGTKYSGSVGPFIDQLLEANKDKVITIGENSVVLDLEKDLEILGVSNNEKTSWRRISQVSRHPANGGLVEVHTRSGRKTTATLTHSFLKRSPQGIVPVLGSDLKVGMRIPVAKFIPQVPNPTEFVKQGDTTFVLDKMFGWVCGIYLADGSLNGNTVRITKIASIVEENLTEFCEQYSCKFSSHHYRGEYGPSKDNIVQSKDLKDFLLQTFGEGSYTKTIGTVAYHAPLEFIQGLIGGFFDGDGNVNAVRQQVRASSRSKPLLEGINRLLGYCSMFGILGQETSIRIPDKTQYTLTLPRKYAAHYKATIGFLLSEKASELDLIIEYNDRDDAHCQQEMIDKIPELGPIIAMTGKLLKMPGQSRTYGRWLKKESIGRKTLEEYVQNFKDMMKVHVDPIVKDDVVANIALLESALAADVVWDEIVDLVYLDDPKEFVYDFTVPGNDSFMVDDNILVHNTLNSVDWDTEILIAKNGKIQSPQIGEFIDSYYEDLLLKDPTRIQNLPDNRIYIELNDGNDWKAVSCDEDGKVMWTTLEAITRHPVINEDGTDTILEVELESGRTIKATKGLSFLTLVDGKVKDINGSELVVGDVLLVANTLKIPSMGLLQFLNLREILLPTEWLYGSEVEKAIHEIEKGDRHWFQENNGKVFTVPYSRSDVFRDAFFNHRNTNTLKPGCVYPKRTRPDISHIPESIALTKEFGFFVGAYLAEGMSNTTQVIVMNNDLPYLKRLEELMEEWNVGTHMVAEERNCEKTGIKGTTTSLIIYSTLLAEVMQRIFGRVSHEKTMPDWVFQAPDAFVQGLVDAYISGDGCVDKKIGCIAVTSVSNDLLTRFRTLLSRYGIFGRITSSMPSLGKFNSVRRNYTLTMPKLYSKAFADQFTLSIQYKQDILEYFHQLTYSERKSNNHRDLLNDIIWDKIISITEVRPIKGWVYDLTVQTTRNFTTLEGTVVKDTFHLAGVAAKSGMTRGVPRLKEVFKVTKSPKATSLSIFLRPEFRESKEKAREVAQDLELTMLRDIVTTVGLYYNPKDEAIVPGDADLLAFYKLFEQRQLMEGTSDEAAATTDVKDRFSLWMLRLEFNKEVMFNRNITMDDVAYVLNEKFADSIHMIYTDFNSEKLIMRIKLNRESDTSDDTDDYSLFKKFQTRLLTTVAVRGVPGIKAVSFSKSDNRVEIKDGKPEKITEYVLDTDGSNYIEVMNHPAVDPTRLYTTNVHDILDILGIEAARGILLSEIDSLFADAGVNYRHLGLLIDSMTRNGRLMSVDRYGINKNNIGPLAKASFEETEKILLKAALFGEMDPVTGVSAKIMTGQPIRGGTTFSHLLLDESALMRLQKGLPPVAEAAEEDVDDVDEEDIAEELAVATDDRCNTVRLRMNAVMPSGDVDLEEPDVIFNVMD